MKQRPDAVEPTVATTGRRGWVPDAVSLLSVFVVVVFLIPAAFVVGFLGAAGRPAMLLGLLALAFWAHEVLLRGDRPPVGPQPVRRWALIFTGAVFVSALAAALRPTEEIERRAADRGVILMVCLLGLLLLAADGIPSRARLDVLLRRLSTAGAVVGVVAIIQFFTGLDLAHVLRYPGLTELTSVQGIQERSDLNRVAATASHPIELGVVLALILPIALHYALHSSELNRRFAWIRLTIIAVAIPLTISRSGTLAMFVVFATMWVSWPRRLRFRSLIVAAVGTVAMRMVIPGLVGTIRSLFTNILYDPSTQGRTEDYDKVGAFIIEKPLFGRGFLTFLPDKYFTLDNQYLLLLVETGIVGFIAFVGLFVVAFRTARRARIGGDEETRSLGQALAASSLAILVSAGTFDMLAFTMVSGVSFLLMGCSGALWRLTAPDRERVEALQGPARPTGPAGP